MTPQVAAHIHRSGEFAQSPRLRLKPKGAGIGRVDGAWWPRSDDLAAELPELLTLLSITLGDVERVLYRFSDWQSAPQKISVGNMVVKFDGYERQPASTISLLGTKFRQVDLLVVGVHSESSDAHTIMTRAAHPSDSSSVDELLGIAPAVRALWDQSLVAEQRWESEGGCSANRADPGSRTNSVDVPCVAG